MYRFVSKPFSAAFLLEMDGEEDKCVRMRVAKMSCIITCTQCTLLSITVIIIANITRLRLYTSASQGNEFRKQNEEVDSKTHYVSPVRNSG